MAVQLLSDGGHQLAETFQRGLALVLDESEDLVLGRFHLLVVEELVGLKLPLTKSQQNLGCV